jgi:hypothetical protein
VLKEASLKMNLRRALGKAVEAKKGGATTPQKDGKKKASGGTPRRKEEGGAKEKDEPRESQGAQETAPSTPGKGEELEPGGRKEDGPPHGGGKKSNAAQEKKVKAAPKQNGEQGGGASAQRMAEGRRLLEELVNKRRAVKESGGVGPSGSNTPGGGDAEFAWDHPTENALLAVFRLSKEEGGEQNGQAARQLYKDLTQLWAPGHMVSRPWAHRGSAALTRAISIASRLEPLC